MTHGNDPAEIAAGHARHYAALLAQEEPGTPGWQFVFGQLSAASTLTNVMAGRHEDGPEGGDEQAGAE